MNTTMLRCAVCGASCDLLQGYIAFMCESDGAKKRIARFECAAEHSGGVYDVSCRDLFGGGWKTFNWLAQLGGKEWFDATQFCELMDELRATSHGPSARSDLKEEH